MKLAFHPYRTMQMRQDQAKVKNRIPHEKMKDIVYEIQCNNCEKIYVGETCRTLKKCISEHKQAVKRHDQKIGIAVNVMSKDNQYINHQVGGGQCEEFENRLPEKKCIRLPNTMNLDRGLTPIMSNMWTPVLNLCRQQQF